MPTYKGSLHRISDAQRCAIVDIFQNYYKIYPNFKFVTHVLFAIVLSVLLQFTASGYPLW